MSKNVEKELNIQLDQIAKMRELASLLDNYFKPMGFALLVFPLGNKENDGRMNYISSAQRPDMIEAMQEFIDKQKAAYPIDDNPNKKGNL